MDPVTVVPEVALTKKGVLPCNFAAAMAASRACGCMRPWLSVATRRQLAAPMPSIMAAFLTE